MTSISGDHQLAADVPPSFKSAGRVQQAALRASRAWISAAAGEPSDAKGARHGHLLALGHEEENLFPSLRGPNGAIAFFNERRIKWWRSPSSGDSPQGSGPTRNLASSQIACVNFLLPLAGQPEVLAAILKRFDPDVERVEPIEYPLPDGGESKSYVEFEWTGLGQTLEGTTPTRGANCTSADALLVARAPGGRRAYLFEWKYVEEYQNDRDLGAGPRGNTRRARYEPLFRNSDSPFNGKYALDALLFEPFYQLTRLLLLGSKMCREGELGVVDYRVVVVCPREHSSYRRRITAPELRGFASGNAEVSQVLAEGLKRPERLRSSSQDELLEGLRPPSDLSDWRDYQRARYGW